MKKLVGRLAAGGLLVAGAVATPAQAANYDLHTYWTGGTMADCLEWQNSIPTGTFARIYESCAANGNGYAFTVAYRTS
ncbi:MAG: hypothetical protein ACTHZ5_10765 [Micrococcaceae bacterium]